MSDDQQISEQVKILNQKEEILRLYKDVGATRVEIASYLDIPLRVLNELISTYSEFKDIIELGETHSQAWWVKKGRASLSNREFNFNMWYAIVRNQFKWADKPSERAVVLKDYSGSFENKIKMLDEQLSAGEIPVEFHAAMLKSLSYEALIQEIVVVKPAIDRMEAERRLQNGEWTQVRYKEEIALLDRLEDVRLARSRQVYADKELIGKNGHMNKRKLPAGVRELAEDAEYVPSSDELLARHEKRKKLFEEKEKKLTITNSKK